MPIKGSLNCRYHSFRGHLSGSHSSQALFPKRHLMQWIWTSICFLLQLIFYSLVIGLKVSMSIMKWVTSAVGASMSQYIHVESVMSCMKWSHCRSSWANEYLMYASDTWINLVNYINENWTEQSQNAQWSLVFCTLERNILAIPFEWHPHTT